MRGFRKRRREIKEEWCAGVRDVTVLVPCVLVVMVWQPSLAHAMSGIACGRSLSATGGGEKVTVFPTPRSITGTRGSVCRRLEPAAARPARESAHQKTLFLRKRRSDPNSLRTRFFPNLRKKNFFTKYRKDAFSRWKTSRAFARRRAPANGAPSQFNKKNTLERKALARLSLSLSLFCFFSLSSVEKKCTRGPYRVELLRHVPAHVRPVKSRRDLSVDTLGKSRFRDALERPFVSPQVFYKKEFRSRVPSPKRPSSFSKLERLALLVRATAERSLLSSDGAFGPAWPLRLETRFLRAKKGLPMPLATSMAFIA